MKNHGNYFFLILSLIGMIWISVLSSANVEKARPNQYEFTWDTIAQSASGTFTIPQQIKNKSGFIYQITAAQLSGTIGSNAILQESAWESANLWVNRDTAAISAAGNYYLEGTTRARRVQVLIQAGAGAQSGQYKVAAQLTEEF
jgi:hypothetical protein